MDLLNLPYCEDRTFSCLVDELNEKEICDSFGNTKLNLKVHFRVRPLTFNRKPNYKGVGFEKLERLKVRIDFDHSSFSVFLT